MSKEPKPEQSPAMAMVETAIRDSYHSRGPSRDQIENVVLAARRMAVMYDFRFDLADGEELAGWHPLEFLYAEACGFSRGCYNQSACLAFEAGLGRKPFLIAGNHEKTPKRVYVDRRFYWYNQVVTCTSFAKDNKSLIACTYKPSDDHYPTKVARRVRITHDDIRKYHAELKQFQAKNGPLQAV